MGDRTMKKAWYVVIAVVVVAVLGIIFIPRTFHNNNMMSDNDRMGMMGGGNSSDSKSEGNSSHMMSEPDVELKDPGTPLKQLNLPPILKPDKKTDSDVYYTVTAQSGQTSFKDGTSTNTLGYNGSYLGPVIQLTRGQKVHIKEVNDLDEKTTFHWHGAIISGKADGGPHDPIKPHSSRNISFTVDQPAATLWFHPHPSGKTAEQVYEGLAGLIYINDKQSKKIALPKKYGVDDFPLVVQDRTFDSNNQFNYQQDYNADGTQGQNILVNGTLNPYIDVSTRFVRLRLLDGSNARNFTFKLSNGQKMYQVAGDGSFLDKPVALNKLKLSAAQRAEIVVDTKEIPDGESLKLTAGGQNVLTMKMGQRTENYSKLPTTLKKMSVAKMPTGDVAKQKLVLSGMSKMVQINGKQFDPDRIDIHSKVGQKQVWTIENKKEMMMNMIHPFHLHGVQFRVVSINGKKPPMNLRGNLDTIQLNPGDVYKITFTFEKKGLYMYHCHILEHEENGMMGQVLVE